SGDGSPAGHGGANIARAAQGSAGTGRGAPSRWHRYIDLRVPFTEAQRFTFGTRNFGAIPCPFGGAIRGAFRGCPTGGLEEMVRAVADRAFVPARGLLEEIGDMVILTGKTVVSALRPPYPY